MKTKLLKKLNIPAGVTTEIVYSVTDDNGCPIDVSSGVTGEYKIAQSGDDEALVSVTSELVFSGSTVTVTLDTSLIAEGSPSVQLTGDFHDQLILEKEGLCIYAARRRVRIEGIIQ